jgi:Eukaryotic cytochrome b561
MGDGDFELTCVTQSKNMSSPHQILGLILLVVFLAQIPIGLLWRQRRLKNEAPPKWVALSHQVLTGFFWVLAVVDAALGFNLALASGFNKIWAPLAIAVFILYLFAFGARACFADHKRDRDEALRLEEESANAWKEYHEQQQNQAPPQYYSAPVPHANGGAVELQNYRAEPEVQYTNVQVPKSY